MTKFEKIGAELQNNSNCRYEADRNFRHSCYLCNLRGINLDCDRCAISFAHDNALEVFDLMAKTDKERIQPVVVQVKIS